MDSRRSVGSRWLRRATAATSILVLAACAGKGGSGTRVTDDRAGLSYELPSGWEEKPRGDLIEFFTSSSGLETENSNGAILGLGPVAGLFAEEAPDLGSMADSVSIGFAEFFVPFEGERDKVTDEAMRVGDRDAHRVGYRITPDIEPEAVVEAVVVDLEDGPAFAVGVVSPSDDDLERQLSGALGSLAPVE
jgi:hypothetical protein